MLTAFFTNKTESNRSTCVDDGDIITAGAVIASLDLGLWLGQKYCGADKALEVSHALDFEMREPIWERNAVNRSK